MSPQPTALGVNGGGEGFSGITGIAVSLDTWKNAVNPSNNFVGIANGPVPGAGNELNYVATNTSIPSLRNTMHHFVVTTTSTGITVTMDGTQVLTYAPACRPTCSSGSPGGPAGSTTSTRSRTCPSRPAPPPSVPTVTGLSSDLGAEHGRDLSHDHRHRLHRSRAQSTSAPLRRDLHREQRDHHHRHGARRHVGTVDVTVTSPGGTSATSSG